MTSFSSLRGFLPYGSLIRRFVRHGTTCVSINNKLGLLFAGDGLSRIADPINPADDSIGSKIEQKVFFLGNYMLVSICGNAYWIQYILDELRPQIAALWTSERCAQFVRDTQAAGPLPVLERYNLKPGALDGKDCSFMFGAYEQNEPILFYANRLHVQQIFEEGAYDVDQDLVQEHFITCKDMGTGGDFAYGEIHRLSILENVNISSGNLAHFEEQLALLLSGMKVACDKDRSTGGYVLVYYMPPPPGVAHIVYDELHKQIPLDITKLRANMYQRLSEAALRSGSFMVDDYQNLFSHYSLQYKAERKALKEKNQRIQSLLRSRRRKFKWYKVYSSI